MLKVRDRPAGAQRSASHLIATAAPAPTAATATTGASVAAHRLRLPMINKL